MAFIPRIKSEIEDLYVTTTDIEVVGGTLLRGSILKKSNKDYFDCDGHIFLKSVFEQGSIIPLSDAYKLFEAKPR